MAEKSSSQTSTGSGPLAHWHFTAEQWKEFRYYEKLEFENSSLLDEKTVLIGGFVIIVLLAIAASFMSNRMGHPGGPAASAFVLVVGSLFLGVCFLIYRLVRKSNEQKLNTLTGKVLINRTSVNVNGVFFEWFGGWGLPEITESYLHVGNEKMLLLHFKCMRWMRLNRTTERIEKTCLVPVPPGKEAEARSAIAEITGKNTL